MWPLSWPWPPSSCWWPVRIADAATWGVVPPEVNPPRVWGHHPRPRHPTANLRLPATIRWSRCSTRPRRACLWYRSATRPVNWVHHRRVRRPQLPTHCQPQSPAMWSSSMNCRSPLTKQPISRRWIPGSGLTIPTLWYLLFMAKGQVLDVVRSPQKDWQWKISVCAYAFKCQFNWN